jgi:DNA-directed RNA polymerase specialized sigma subunit
VAQQREISTTATSPRLNESKTSNLVAPVTVMPLECFYTLPDSLEEHRVIWRIEPRLRDRVNELRQKIDPLAEFNEKILEARIARYLFEKLQQHPEHELLRTHWIAFLERRCEKVANKLAHLGSSSFRDLVLMGAEVAIHPVNFFENFDSQRSQIEYWYPTLKRFSDSKIQYIILNKFQEITGGTLCRTNLGLAARSSRKRVKEALHHSGYKQAELSQYLLAWQCFQEVKTSFNCGVNNFKAEQFQKVAKRYGEFRDELALPEVQNQDINGEEIKTWLENIGTAIRQFLDPPLCSLDTPLRSQADEEISLLENISYQPRVDEEMNQSVAALREFISHLLEEFKETQEKQLLFLRYGLELKQSQIGKELSGQAQYQISRLLQRLNNRIMTEICDWVKQHLELEPSSEGLNEIEGVLCQYYSDQIDGFFEKTIYLLEKQSQEVLKLFYIIKLNPSEIANKIHKSEAEVKELIEAMKQGLYNCMVEQIQAEIQLQFQPQGVAKKRITAITETRLESILQLYFQ